MSSQPEVSLSVPSQPRVQVLIHGLFAAAMKGTTFECGRLADDIRGHDFKMTICNRSDSSDFIDIIPRNNQVVKITSQRPSGVCLYQPTPTFNRLTATDRYDFRWAVDLESEIYPKRCKKYSEKLTPRFSIETGMAYTLMRSIPLKKLADDRFSDFGMIGQVLAIGINDDEIAKISVGNFPLTLNQNHKYNIVLRYDCKDSNPRGRTRSDFHHLLSAFGPPSTQNPNNVPELWLPLDNSGAAEQAWKEYEGLKSRGGGETSEEQLAGLKEIYTGYKERAAARTDPCGMGFLGDSCGLDQQPTVSTTS